MGSVFGALLGLLVPMILIVGVLFCVLQLANLLDLLPSVGGGAGPGWRRLG